ncbi:MAG: hypothetical protein U1G08_21115 [Verrucomicrobiota bacterium]
MSNANQGLDLIIGAKAQASLTAVLSLAQGFVQGIGMSVAQFSERAARALSEMTGHALEVADEMGKAAQKAGVTAEKFSAVAFAAKLSDVSIETLQVGFKGLSAWMERNGQIGRDIVEVLVEQAGAFEGMADGAAKTNLAVELFGRSGLEMIPLLNQGSDALRRQMEEAKKLGVVITEDAARAAETFNDRLTTLRSRLEGISLQLTSGMLPGLLKITDTLSALSEQGKVLIAILQVFVTVQVGILEHLLTSLAEKFVEVGSGIFEFGKALVTGASLSEAWTKAQKGASDALEEFRAAMERYRRERDEEGDDKKKAKVVKLADAYDSLSMQLKNLQGLSQGLSGDRLAAGLQLQLKALDDLEKKAGKATQVLGDGQMVYTEEGLKSAERLLEIETQRQQITRELEGMTFSGRMRQNIEAMGTEMQRIADVTTNTILGAFDSLADGLTSVVMGTKTWADALRQIGTSILTGVVRGIIGIGTQWIATQLLMAIAGKSIQAATVAAAAPIAGTSAAMWAPAATLATIATYGSAAALAPGFIGTANLLTASLSVGQSLAAFAEGGIVSGPGTANSDSILARLSDGEGILTATATDRIGADGLAHLNAGGDVADLAGSQPVQLSVAIFGLEAAGQKWLESREGQKAMVNLIREEVGKYS